MKSRKLFTNFLKLRNWILSFSIITLVLSCEEQNKEITPVSDYSVLPQQEVNIIELNDDSSLERNKEVATGRTETVDGIPLKRVTTYVNKMASAEGKLYYKIYKTSDHSLVSRSGKIDVSRLATHSTTAVRYTTLVYLPNITLERNGEYEIELVCENCVANNNEKAVNWWSSNFNAYDDGTMVTPFGDVLVNYDFAFHVDCLAPDGTEYYNGFNTNRQTAYAFNVGNMKPIQTFHARVPEQQEIIPTGSAEIYDIENPNQGGTGDANKLQQLSTISLWMSRGSVAKGDLEFTLYRKSDNALLAKSDQVDVRGLIITDNDQMQGTQIIWDAPVMLNKAEQYFVQVKCSQDALVDYDPLGIKAIHWNCYIVSGAQTDAETVYPFGTAQVTKLNQPQPSQMTAVDFVIQTEIENAGDTQIDQIVESDTEKSVRFTINAMYPDTAPNGFMNSQVFTPGAQ